MPGSSCIILKPSIEKSTPMRLVLATAMAALLVLLASALAAREKRYNVAITIDKTTRAEILKMMGKPDDT